MSDDVTEAHAEPVAAPAGLILSVPGAETAPPAEPAALPVVDELPTPPVEVAPAHPTDPIWEDVLANGPDVTQRLAVPGGYLYRTTWTHRGPFGFRGDACAAMAFVPGE